MFGMMRCGAGRATVGRMVHVMLSGVGVAVPELGPHGAPECAGHNQERRNEKSSPCPHDHQTFD